MAAGSSYPIDLLNPEQTEVIQSGYVSFTDSTNQPSPSSGGIVAGNAFAPTGLTGATQITSFVGGVATVAPTTGTFAVGDFVVSRNGKMFVCTAAGTPGTWVEPASITYAPLASPTLTGVPAAPTAAVDTATTQLATTAYVINQAYSKLASPTFTGTVIVPAAAGV